MRGGSTVRRCAKLPTGVHEAIRWGLSHVSKTQRQGIPTEITVRAVARNEALSANPKCQWVVTDCRSWGYGIRSPSARRRANTSDATSVPARADMLLPNVEQSLMTPAGAEPPGNEINALPRSR